jgi:glycosyltransferase involved in cell wall biosynthesis
MTAIYAAFDVFPRPKGSSSHIASMVQALAKSFHGVRLLCLGTPEMPLRQCEDSIEILRYTTPNAGLTARATGFANFVREHASLPGTRLNVFRDPWGGWPLLDAHPGTRSIFEVNALPSWELEYSYPRFARNPALRAKIGDLESRCLREADGILCVSKVTAVALASRGVPADRVSVIPNVAHDIFFDPPEAPFPLGPGQWFAYSGGLQPWQGVETALDAFALVADDLPNLRFCILRGASDAGLTALERRIARLGLTRRAAIAGPYETPHVAAILPKFLFTVMPLADTPRNTRQGCCPVKMVESMAAGTPVIASDLAVGREWIRQEENGCLARPGDPRSWALAIHRLATDEPFRRTLAANAKDRAREVFSTSIVHARLDRVFHSIRGKGQDNEADSQSFREAPPEVSRSRQITFAERHIRWAPSTRDSRGTGHDR